MKNLLAILLAMFFGISVVGCRRENVIVSYNQDSMSVKKDFDISLGPTIASKIDELLRTNAFFREDSLWYTKNFISEGKIFTNEVTFMFYTHGYHWEYVRVILLSRIHDGEEVIGFLNGFDEKQIKTEAMFKEILKEIEEGE